LEFGFARDNVYSDQSSYSIVLFDDEICGTLVVLERPVAYPDGFATNKSAGKDFGVVIYQSLSDGPRESDVSLSPNYFER
jgi:hypothetical protein